MEGKTPHRWRRWLVGILIALIALPLLVICIFKARFSANAIRPEQMQPPGDYQKLRPALAALPEPARQPPPKTYDDFVAASPNRRAAAIYKKWFTRPNNDTAWRDRFLKLTGDPPLTADQTRWLAENPDFVQDMIELAKEGGLPTMTFEQAASYKEDPAELPVLNLLFFQRFAKALVTESRRCREAGQFPEAAEALLAVRTLAKSVREPFLIHYSAACSLQTIADTELSRWLAQEPPPPEIARRLRDGLINDTATRAQQRRVVEFEYLTQRYWTVQLVEKPYWDLMSLMFYKMGYEGGFRSRGHDVWYYLDNPRKSFAEFTHECNTTMATAVTAEQIKASAKWIIEDLDAEWIPALGRVAFGRVDPNAIRPQRVSKNKAGLDFSIGTMIDEVITRTNVAQAMANLDLTALDSILNQAGKMTRRADPFTDRPLSAIDETTTTLIYSVGPDLKDQRAALSYDPTNGIFSAGDIVLRIPH